jgi:hypothetical protein
MAQNIDIDARKDETYEEASCIFVQGKNKTEAIKSINKIEHTAQRAWARVRCLLIDPLLFREEKYKILSISFKEMESVNNPIEKTWTLMRLYQAVFELFESSCARNLSRGALAEAGKISDSDEKARALGEITGIFLDNGSKKDLNKFLIHFIKIVEKEIIPAVKSGLYGAAAGLCFSFKEKETGLFWFRKAILASEEIVYLEDRLWTITILGEIMYNYGEKAAAMNIYNLIEKMVEKLTDPWVKGDIGSKIGVVLAGLGETTAAYNFFSSARYSANLIENSYALATLSLEIEKRYLNSGIFLNYCDNKSAENKTAEHEENISDDIFGEDILKSMSKGNTKFPKELVISRKVLKLADMAVKWNNTDQEKIELLNLLSIA